MPRLARAGDGAWMAAFDRRGAGLATRVAVWKGGEAVSLGDGDRFEAVDLACSERRCALLTTRLARVAGAGAELWVGSPREPATSWRRIEITPKEGVSDAYPSSIVRLDGAGATPPPGASATGSSSPLAPASAGAEAGAPNPAAGPATGGILVSLVEGDDLVFYAIDEAPPAGAAHEIARVAAPYGVIDATTAPAPVALVFGTELDDDGCARGGVKLALARPGQKDLALDVPTPPVWASLRRLERGVLATWVAPLGCEVKRRVAFAAVLGPDGAPLSAPMAVADATAAAVSAHGGEVDLWLQQEQGAVLWIRATCAAP